MGCQQSLCAGPESDRDISADWSDGAYCLDDGEWRALRAQRRRMSESSAQSQSFVSEAARGPSIYRADIGPLIRLPIDFDPFAMARSMYFPSIKTDEPSAKTSSFGGWRADLAGEDEDSAFDIEGALERRFGLKAVGSADKTKKRKPTKGKKRDMLIVYTLTCRLAPDYSRARHVAKDGDLAAVSTGKGDAEDMGTSARTECRFAWTEPDAPTVSYRVRARRGPAYTGAAETATASMEDGDYDPTRAVTMTSLGRLRLGDAGPLSSNEGDIQNSILLQGPTSDPVKPAAFAWASLSSSPDTEMHIDVVVDSGDGVSGCGKTTRGRVVVPLDTFSTEDNCPPLKSIQSKEEACAAKVLGLPVMDTWLPMRTVEESDANELGDSLGRVNGLVRVMVARVICSESEALNLVRIANPNSGPVSANIKRKSKARVRALARELSLAVESAVCMKASVERVPAVDSRCSSNGNQTTVDREDTALIDEETEEDRSGLMLRRGPLYYDEFGFMVPSMESPINESMSQLLRRQWLHLREYHAQLSVLRSFEWVASEWSHDHNLVGFNAHKLLITSHLASARISSGVLSHKSDDSGSRLPPDNDSSRHMDEQSKISGRSNASNKDSLDSVMALHSRHSSTPKMVMKGISSNVTKPLLSNQVGKRVVDGGEEITNAAPQALSSDVVSFHMVSHIDSSVKSKRAYQKHLVGVMPTKIHSSNESWDMRPLTGPNRAHTPSDVGHTYEELVQQMCQNLKNEDESLTSKAALSSATLPTALNVPTEEEEPVVLLGADTGSHLSREVSLSRGARLQYQRAVTRTPAMARMVWSGAVPMSEREDLYMRASGASTRRLAEGVHYYSRLQYQVIVLFEKNKDRDQYKTDKGTRRASDRAVSQGSSLKDTASVSATSPSSNTSTHPSLFSADSFTYDMDDNVYFALQMKHRNLEVVMKQIDADVPRTFGGCRALEGGSMGKSGRASISSSSSSALPSVSTSSEMRKRLGRVLKCYAMRNPSLGYCQSMNLVVGLFLSIGFSEESSFWLLTELAERIVPGYWVPSMTDTQIDTRTAVDLVRMRMGGELGRHLDKLGVPLSVVVWQMILPLFISKGSTLAAVRLLDVIFYECSSLPLLAFVLSLLEPWKEDLLEAEDLPEAMDVIMSAPSLLVDIDLTMQIAFDLVGVNATGMEGKFDNHAQTQGNDGGERENADDPTTTDEVTLEPSMTNHLVSTSQLDERISSIEQLRINMASLRKRHATAYEPHAEKSIRDATKRRHLATSGLDLESFDKVYSLFVEESRIASSEHGIKDYRRLSSLDHFTTVIRSVAPKLVSTNSLAKNLFEAFDSDGTGSVDIDELFCGISILSPMAAASRKMEVCFDLFDLNSDGYISGADLVEMLSTVVRLNRHHRQVSESVGDMPSTETTDTPKEAQDNQEAEFNAELSPINDDELLDIVRSQLARLGKNMTDNDISFKDFCTIVNSHPQILSAMQLNTGEGGASSADADMLTLEDADKLPRRRRASTATF